jgi:hypothetical protein
VRLTERLSHPEPLRSVLERIALQHDGFGAMIYDVAHHALHEGVVIFVNARAITPDLAMMIRPGDRIAVTPFYTGG